MINNSVASASFSTKARLVDPLGRAAKCRRISGLKVMKATNAQAPSKMINGTSANGNGRKLSSRGSSSSTTLPVWSNLEPKGAHLLDDQLGLDGLVFRRTFEIRSYEIGSNGSTSILTVMNHFQEAAVNHMTSLGFLGDHGSAATGEMCKRDLIWVLTRINVVVDRYPAWGDIVEVETWLDASGKNGVRRDWLVRDGQTGQILTRATSVWVMMNKYTRRLSKIPEEARKELEPVFIEKVPIMEDHDNMKILHKFSDSTADYIQGGLTPRWSDLDVNQHVNNVKYVGWILESAPDSIFESHDLTSMTLEYRRECSRDVVLQSLTTVSGHVSSDFGIECGHMLQLEGGSEVVRARTEWRPKRRADIGFRSYHQ